MCLADAQRDEFDIISSDRLSILANVKNLGQTPGIVDTLSDPTLTVYCENGVPVALSEPTDVVLYTPASGVADLLIYESGSRRELGDCPPGGDILGLVSSSSIRTLTQIVGQIDKYSALHLPGYDT